MYVCCCACMYAALVEAFLHIGTYMHYSRSLPRHRVLTYMCAHVQVCTHTAIHVMCMVCCWYRRHHHVACILRVGTYCFWVRIADHILKLRDDDIPFGVAKALVVSQLPTTTSIVPSPLNYHVSQLPQVLYHHHRTWWLSWKTRGSAHEQQPQRALPVFGILIITFCDAISPVKKRMPVMTCVCVRPSPGRGLYLRSLAARLTTKRSTGARTYVSWLPRHLFLTIGALLGRPLRRPGHINVGPRDGGCPGPHRGYTAHAHGTGGIQLHSVGVLQKQHDRVDVHHSDEAGQAQGVCSKRYAYRSFSVLVRHRTNRELIGSW